MLKIFPELPASPHWRNAHETAILTAFDAWPPPSRKAAFQQAVFVSVADGTPDLSNHLARGRDQAGEQIRLLALTARIVSAHVAHNRVRCGELPALIQKIHASLAQAGAAASGTAGPAGLVPAVPPERSVFPDYIICLENGRRFRTMRRHLMAAFGLTPEQYRRRWGLPHDYPMIAPGYTAARSGLAKATGLGRRKTAKLSHSSHHTR